MPRLGPPLAAALLTAYWAAYTVKTQFAVDLRWAWLYELWYSWAPYGVGAAASVLVGAIVGRWWVLLLGLTPLAVLGFLQARGHVAPWHEAGPPLTQALAYGGWWPIFWLYVAPLGLGVVIRKGLAPASPAGSAVP